MSTHNFPAFSKAVAKNLESMKDQELFVVDGIDLYTSYLLSFPEGTNTIFRTNTEHDCSCCKNFIRNMGNVVAIVDGKKHSVWRAEGLPEPYATVAKAMDDLVCQLPIKGVFRTKETGYGSQYNYDSHDNRRWDHFYGSVSAKHRSSYPDQVKGDMNTTAQVLKRGLETLKQQALIDVLDLIENNSLYRGQEFEASVRKFMNLQKEYMNAANPELSLWSNIQSSAARFRNTAIGTLVQDISDGVDLEEAVRKFEAMVAPTNYKRPTTLITPKMVESAIATLHELGLEHAVERRFAKLSDISVNDVLFVDNSVREQMKSGVNNLRDLLMESAHSKPKKSITASTNSITIHDFVQSVVPNAKKIEVEVKTQHEGNFVSLTAPQYKNTGKLFKWNNDFAWSYAGEVTDSIKQRVKKAGGNTNADLRVSLAWSNFDDLDIHAQTPQRQHISFRNKAGILDVDMNAGGGTTREPVENLSWIRPPSGEYKIWVNQFCRRETSNIGFTLELECSGELHQFHYNKTTLSGQDVNCLTFNIINGKLQDIKIMNPDIRGGNLSKNIWGIKTEKFVPVSTLLTSPNHWVDSGAVGQQHWFFILKDCLNPDPVRGIYNEFLRGDLDRHRKVFEVLGSKTRCEPTDDQLSGIGFSQARNDTVNVKVTANNDSIQTYTVTF